MCAKATSGEAVSPQTLHLFIGVANVHMHLDTELRVCVCVLHDSELKPNERGSSPFCRCVHRLPRLFHAK